MPTVSNSRRHFLLSGLAIGGAILAGCDSGSDKEITVTKQEDPMKKAQDSMDFMKGNLNKKGARK